jgi:two-component system NarL family sensor kinase
MQISINDIVLLIIVSSVILLLLLSFIATILFLYQKKNISYTKELADVKNNYDKALLQTQLEIQEQTFQNISQEIHDNIGLSLTLAKLQLNTVNFEDNKTPANINSSIDLISKAIYDLSDISKSLNSDFIKNNGLYNTLKIEIEKISRAGRHAIEFSEEGNIVFLNAHKELVLYRIAQEALNNILKHAAASFINITLKYEETQISLFIKDNGCGFDKIETEHRRGGKINNGLTNMLNRALLLGGNLAIESAPGQGTSIFITVPYQ